MKRLMVLTCVALLATPVSAGHPLWNDAKISKGLFDLAVADQVRRNCSTISGRMLRGYDHARQMYKHAQSLGYSRKQVEDFVESKSEQSLMRKRVLAYFVQNDASHKTPDGLCVLGKKEINNNSAIGKMLRG